ENAHLKATYKNMFDSISVSRAQTKTIIASFQNELQSNIYKNAKLRMQLFKKVSDQKNNTQDTSENTKFAKQPIVENLPKVGKTNALSNPVTSNSVSTPQESKSVNNDKVIAPGMFRINPSKTSREEKHVSNTVSASTRAKPITVSQLHVITKKDVNSNINDLSSTGQLDLPCDIQSEYDSFNSQDFSRDDDLPSHDNEDKVFNPGILSHEKSVKIITRVAQEKKLVVSYASLSFEDFDPPFYELLVFKEVPTSMRLLSFSSENEEKVFKPGIYTSKKVHCCFLPELSHPAMMTDNRTMAKMLRAPTEGCAEAIIVPPILAEQFELKHSLINMMTSEQFFGLEKDNPHDHIRWFNKITSTIKYKDVPNCNTPKLGRSGMLSPGRVTS
nr:reverse transcriptase domain-containing protein [Tanacetum cinerariifolium]